MTIGCIRRTPDAKIMTMKDGRAHLPHKPEHAVNLETAAVVRLTVRDAHPGDARAMLAMPPTRPTTPQPCCRPPLVLLDRVGDKPYHGNATTVGLPEPGLPTYESEPNRTGHRSPRRAAARARVYQPRRIRSALGPRLLRPPATTTHREPLMRLATPEPLVHHIQQGDSSCRR